MSRVRRVPHLLQKSGFRGPFQGRSGYRYRYWRGIDNQLLPEVRCTSRDPFVYLRRTWLSAAVHSGGHFARSAERYMTVSPWRVGSGRFA